jgi:tRNA(fMet)-specific endonuclease VapC
MDDRLRILDMRIAAIVLARNAILVTRNLKDFAKVPNMEIEDWGIAEEAAE